jgi:hypothetical protein
MAIRFAAVLLTGLAITAPAVAETEDLSASLFLGPQEAETAASITADLAWAGDTLLAQLPPVDPPGPLALLDGDVPHPGELEHVASLDEPPLVNVEASLAPEFFLDANEGETFAWIAADLAASAEIMTGSIPSIVGVNPLTDDAADLQAYLTP